MSTSNGLRWARRVRQELIRRLYALGAPSANSHPSLDNPVGAHGHAPGPGGVIPSLVGWCHRYRWSATTSRGVAWRARDLLSPDLRLTSSIHHVPSLDNPLGRMVLPRKDAPSPQAARFPLPIQGRGLGGEVRQCHRTLGATPPTPYPRHMRSNATHDPIPQEAASELTSGHMHAYHRAQPAAEIRKVDSESSLSRTRPAFNSQNGPLQVQNGAVLLRKFNSNRFVSGHEQQ